LETDTKESPISKVVTSKPDAKSTLEQREKKKSKLRQLYEKRRKKNAMFHEVIFLGCALKNKTNGPGNRDEKKERDDYTSCHIRAWYIKESK